MLTREDLEALVFDLDGTLVDSRIDFALMRERILEYLEARGMDTTSVAGHMVLEMIAWGRRQLPAEDHEQYRVETRRILHEVEHPHAASADLFPGVQEALEAAQQAGLRLGIITRSSQPYTDLLLARHPLPLSVVVTRDHVETAHLKPRPEQLWLALRQLGAAPARGLMVGDHPTDIQCGRAAGTRVAGVLSGSGDEQCLRDAGAELVARDVAEVVWSILDGKSGRPGAQVPPLAGGEGGTRSPGA
ncbi:MAG: HAD-IA family hydrolase [candidate division WS1 bacterium]|jgi:phosphoglycolate phosphatase|nr:HAD-IA family hydrolase [candidate division WS1 bacterium]